jgi:hypothetical protein
LIRLRFQRTIPFNFDAKLRDGIQVQNDLRQFDTIFWKKKPEHPNVPVPLKMLSDPITAYTDLNKIYR